MEMKPILQIFSIRIIEKKEMEAFFENLKTSVKR